MIDIVKIGVGSVITYKEKQNKFHKESMQIKMRDDDAIIEIH